MSTLPEPYEDTTPRGPVPWASFVSELLELYAPPLRAKATCAKMRQVLGLVTGLGVTSTAELTPSLVARFVAGQSGAVWSTYTKVAYLRAACNYAEGRGYCRVSPFAVRKRWVRRGTPAGPKKHHSREDVARVLALMAADVGRKRGWSQWRARRLHALASTVAYTGLRKAEALHLRVEDVDFEARVLLIVPRVGNRLKTEGSAQPVPIPDALVPVLADWLPHLALPDGAPPATGPTPDANPGGKRDPGWVFPNSYRTGPWTGGSPGRKPIDRMKRLGERAGVEGFTFLSLRHSFATHAEYWGLSDAMIQRILRHTSGRTQWHYRHADAENMRAKVGGIGFGHDLAGTEAVAVGRPMPARPAAAAAPAAPPVNRKPKLDDDDASEMRRLRAGGWTYAALARRYGVAKSTVHSTLSGATHRQAPDYEP